MRFQYRDRSNMVFPETWCSLKHGVRSNTVFAGRYRIWCSTPCSLVGRGAHPRMYHHGELRMRAAPRATTRLRLRAPSKWGSMGGTPSRARGLVCMQENNPRQTGEVNNGSWTTEEEAIQATKCKD
jgi:hypothetical protein